MSLIWKARIAIARWLLADGPEGYDYYFRAQSLSYRKSARLRAPLDWSEVMEEAQ
jgi:hypothetical protein